MNVHCASVTKYNNIIKNYTADFWRHNASFSRIRVLVFWIIYLLSNNYIVNFTRNLTITYFLTTTRYSYRKRPRLTETHNGADIANSKELVVLKCILFTLGFTFFKNSAMILLRCILLLSYFFRFYDFLCFCSYFYASALIFMLLSLLLLCLFRFYLYAHFYYCHSS